MRKSAFLTLTLLLLISASCTYKHPQVKISGEYKLWHTLVFECKGNYTSEFDEVNPFLNYRLDVTFTNGDYSCVVPGYFAGDGDAGESGAHSGNIWQVKFTPGLTGHWTFKVLFRRGEHIAVSDSSDWGIPQALDGYEGSFDIGPSDKTGNDFRAKGRIVDGGEHYMKYEGTGEYFIKAGADSPENFLAYAGFDQIPATHRYEAHVKDWKPGDPDWKKGRGKGIIGAISYLASQGMNSVYMILMNVMGDGNDIWPWSDPYERARYDISKLAQWDRVFTYMEEKGVLAHFVLQETENEILLDQGQNDKIRKLFYRELVARFSHHLGIIWNLGEENGVASWTPLGQDDGMRKEMAAYLKKLIPYNSIIMMHTHADLEHQELMLIPLLGNPDFSGPSLQVHAAADVHQRVLKWRSLSEFKGRNWICNFDELGPADSGVVPDDNDPDHDLVRTQCLWGSLMAGGGGVEWYFGYKYPHNDLNCEDWRSREQMWKQTAIARQFFEALPLEEMKPFDTMVKPDNAFCFADPSKLIVVFLQPGSKEFSLKGIYNDGEWQVLWVNPKVGNSLEGSPVNVKNGQCSLKRPAEMNRGDLVCKLTRSM
ncbi:MAG: DUF5060 domain-containing protein [Bacteroidota bacterium]